MMTLSSSDHVILEHYENRWGKATQVYTISDPRVPAQANPLYVAEFTLPIDRLTIYASIGMSRAPMISGNPQRDHRVEIFLGTFQPHPVLPKRIAMLAAYPHKGNKSIDNEHTIPLGEPIVPNSQLTSVIFTPPYFDPPGFHHINMGSYHIRILWVIPLYESEREFKIKDGWKSLRKIFEEKHVAIGDLMRVRAI
jgi:hypothetical protein